LALPANSPAPEILPHYAGSKRFFSDPHRENLVGLLEVRLKKVRGHPHPQDSTSLVFNSLKLAHPEPPAVNSLIKLKVLLRRAASSVGLLLLDFCHP